MSLALAASGPSAYWYLTRGTGAVSLLLLTASVVLGILGSLRFAAGPRWPRFALDTLHRDVSLLVLAVLAVHIVTSVLDSFAPISLLDAVIPFVSSYRPLWLGLGAVAFDLLLALAITSLMRRRIGFRGWRAVHWLAYVSWPVAVLHGLGTGSDTKLTWMLALTVICLGAVLVAVAVRIARAQPGDPRLRSGLAVLALLTPLGIAIFTLAGPLQRGWARRAGTPASLLGGARTAAALGGTAVSRSVPASGSTATATATPLPRHFTAQLEGTARQLPAPGGAVVDLALRLSGSVTGKLRVRVAGSPIPGGGLSMTGSQVDLLASGLPSVMQGRITSLQGQQFLARVIDAEGGTLDLHARLNISDSGQVTGSLAAQRGGGG
jgi:hypothetical protein